MWITTMNDLERFFRDNGIDLFEIQTSPGFVSVKWWNGPRVPEVMALIEHDVELLHTLMSIGVVLNVTRKTGRWWAAWLLFRRAVRVLFKGKIR